MEKVRSFPLYAGPPSDPRPLAEHLAELYRNATLLMLMHIEFPSENFDVIARRGPVYVGQLLLVTEIIELIHILTNGEDKYFNVRPLEGCTLADAVQGVYNSAHDMYVNHVVGPDPRGVYNANRVRILNEYGTALSDDVEDNSNQETFKSLARSLKRTRSPIALPTFTHSGNPVDYFPVEACLLSIQCISEDAASSDTTLADHIHNILGCMNVIYNKVGRARTKLYSDGSRVRKAYAIPTRSGKNELIKCACRHPTYTIHFVGSFESTYKKTKERATIQGVYYSNCNQCDWAAVSIQHGGSRNNIYKILPTASSIQSTKFTRSHMRYVRDAYFTGSTLNSAKSQFSEIVDFMNADTTTIEASTPEAFYRNYSGKYSTSRSTSS